MIPLHQSRGELLVYKWHIMMYNLFNRIKRGIVTISMILFFPMYGICNYISFLPMEDSMSAARNVPEILTENIKPYRQSFNLGTNESSHKSFFEFTTSDICAFILLAGIYVMLVRKSSKARNASF